MNNFVDFELSDELVSEEEKTWASMVHLSSLLSFFATGLGFLVPLFVYLQKSEGKPFLKKAAADSFNFQIALVLVAVASFIITVLTFGLGFIAVLAVVIINVISPILAAMAAKNGLHRKYIFSLPILG